MPKNGKWRTLRCKTQRLSLRSRGVVTVSPSWRDTRDRSTLVDFLAPIPRDTVQDLLGLTQTFLALARLLEDIRPLLWLLIASFRSSTRTTLNASSLPASLSSPSSFHPSSPYTLYPGVQRPLIYIPWPLHFFDKEFVLLYLAG